MRWLVGWLLCSSAWAAPTVAHQGRVVDATGAPLSGSVDLTFRVYDADGVVVWTEEQVDVTVVDGMYAVSLGEDVSLETAWPVAESLKTL